MSAAGLGAMPQQCLQEAVSPGDTCTKGQAGQQKGRVSFEQTQHVTPNKPRPLQRGVDAADEVGFLQGHSSLSKGSKCFLQVTQLQVPNSQTTQIS